MMLRNVLDFQKWAVTSCTGNPSSARLMAGCRISCKLSLQKDTYIYTLKCTVSQPFLMRLCFRQVTFVKTAVFFFFEAIIIAHPHPQPLIESLNKETLRIYLAATKVLNCVDPGCSSPRHGDSQTVTFGKQAVLGEAKPCQARQCRLGTGSTAEGKHDKIKSLPEYLAKESSFK